MTPPNPAAFDYAPKHLLWTGGWDSTFRLLQLLLLERRAVQPHYVADPRRRSAAREQEAMRAIRESLLEEHPSAARRLLPVRVTALGDLPPEPGLTASFRAIARRHMVGGQYEWLARYGRHAGIESIELCVHRDDQILAAMRACGVDDPREPAVGPAAARDGEEPQRLFGCFAYPLAALSKQEMAELAARNGWSAIMNRTWFCHRPRPDGDPCGRCPPCLYAIEEGMGWRIPRRARWVGLWYRRVERPFLNRMRAIYYYALGGCPRAGRGVQKKGAPKNA